MKVRSVVNHLKKVKTIILKFIQIIFYFKINYIFIFSDMKYLLSSLKGYGILLQEISNRLDSQEAILRTLSREKGLPTVNSMTSDLGLNLPFNDIVEFTEFNTKLEDQKFREDFVSLNRKINYYLKL